MFEVTEDNYHTFLTLHGQNLECAERVILQYDNTESYFKLQSVRLWVEASKMFVKLNGPV